MSSVKKNFLYNIIYQILAIIIPLITAPYVSRTLGPNGIGIYSYAYSIANYFLLFAMLGISNYGNRSVASVKNNQKKLDKTFMEIYQIQMSLFIIISIIYIAYILFFCEENKVVALVMYFYILSAFFDISWLFFGLEKFKLTVTRNIVIKIVTTIMIFLFVKNDNHIIRYSIIMCVGSLLSQLYLWRYVGKYINIKIRRPIINTVHIKSILILFIPILSYSVYKIMDKIMIGSITDYTQVGFYENAEKIINIPMGIITALGTVMLPRISNLVANGKSEKIDYYMRISIRFVTFVGCAITFGLIGISDILAPVYFGESFRACSILIASLSVSVLFICWANVLRTQYIIPNKLDNIYVISTIIGAILNFMINIVLIPKFNAFGATIGTIIAEFSVMFCQMYLVRKKVKAYKLILKEMPIIIIGILMSVIIKILSSVLVENISSLLILVIIGALIYLLLTLGYFEFKKDELYLLGKKQFINKLNR